MATMSPPKKRPKPAANQVNRVIASFRGTEDFREWIQGFAASQRLNVSFLIEHALVAYAEQLGYKEPPPER